MTIKNLYPKARPHIIYNVINGRPELPAQASFSRSSEATYVDRAGIIRTAAVDEPRFNYDPTTGEFLGLLLEEGTENLVQWSSDPQAYSTANPAYWNPISATFGHPDPMGQSNACEIEVDQSNYSYWRDIRSAGNVISGKIYWISLFVKPVTGGSDTISFQIDQNNFSGRRSFYRYTVSTNNLAEISSSDSLELKVDSYSDGWVRLSSKLKANPNGNTPYRWVLMNRTISANDPVEKYQTYGWQIQQSLGLSNYIPVYNSDTAAAATSPDAFSLTTASDFDNGFSLLLDSNTTTDDFIYKIKAGGSTIAELNNDNGTLDWVIDGTSAATSDPQQYPQIGAIQPGRVRTVSSFGAAGDGDQTNYLYTEGLSFPTVAEPAVGADELEFGTGQTVKAVYVWDGQLSNTEAVSVIKGEYNIILDEPIEADTYSFVYHTDPTNVGEASITLPYIVPTVSMRVYWGDTTSDRYEPGVTPSHTYPYPGQYRIQIEADDGFDSVRLADVDDAITRVDQWAPQHRVGAAGDGFTGDDMESLLRMQRYCIEIPPFKYTNLTSLNAAFNSTNFLLINNWDWVPYELESCTDLGFSFYAASQQAADYSNALRLSFPQLQTSSVLTDVNHIWANSGVKGWKDEDGNLTDQPFTNTENVTNWQNAFANNGISSLSVNTQGAYNLAGTFQGNYFTTSPYFNAPNCTNFSYIFQKCTQMTTMNPSIANSTYSNGTNFTNAWKECSALTSFPLIDTSSGTNFNYAWNNCTSLTSFPLIDTSSAQSVAFAWYNCSSLDNIANAGESFSFPLLDFSKVTYALKVFYGCDSFISLPVFDFSLVTNFSYAYFNCSSLTAFPATDLPVCTNFSYSFRGCSSVTVFPSIDMQAGTTFVSAWQYDALLADFPANMFDTTGTLVSNAFQDAWQQCALTAQSIENILVSLDTNGASGITLGIQGGTNAGQSTWTAAANTAYTNLINKGWTITSNP